jgi:hypothetical protein
MPEFDTCPECASNIMMYSETVIQCCECDVVYSKVNGQWKKYDGPLQWNPHALLVKGSL